ncbi:MAG: glycosyltransferase family 9 protein [Bacteroidia bacterium]
MASVDSWIANFLILHYRLLNFPIYALVKKWFKPLPQGGVKKILLLRQGGIGDTIVALPAILSIQHTFPNAQIDLLTHHVIGNTVGVPDILPANFFEQVFKYRRFVEAGLVKILRANKYDLFIELPSEKASLFFELRSIWLAKRIGAKSGLGWQVSATTLFRKVQERNLHFDDEKTRLLKILNLYSPAFSYKTSQLNDVVDEFTQSTDQLSGTNYIGLAFSAGEERKIWPLENFKAVAKYFADKGLNVLLIGGSADKAKAEEITCTVPNTINLCGELEVKATAAVLKQCDLLISNDTGSIHLAYTVGTPVIGIYSGKDYSNRWFPPVSPYNKVLRNASVPCVICYKNKCADNICMKSITVQEVIYEAIKILNIQRRV